MKLLLISDVHNAWGKLQQAITLGNNERCDALLFAGDAESPDIYRYLEEFDGEIHTVWGNNDVPRLEFSMYKIIHPKIIHHGEYMGVQFGTSRIFMSHYPEPAEKAARTGTYANAIHGHTHRTRIEKVNERLIINPGELCGKRYGTATCMIFDTETKETVVKTLSNDI